MNMQVIAPKPETASITAQERESIRALVRKGCDPVAVTELFGLRDGELKMIVNGESCKSA